MIYFSSYLFLIGAFLFNSIANILLKIGSTNGIVLNTYNPILLFKENIYLVCGLLFFAVNVILYFMALKNIPVSLAYPVMVTMSLLIIGSYAFIFGGEHFTYYHAIGYALIVAGIVFTFLGNA